MSSVMNEAVQMLVDRLRNYSDLQGLVGDRIYDRVPKSVAFPYVSIGPADMIDDDDECITGRVITQQVDIWSRYQGGFKESNEISDTVKTAVHQYHADLDQHALVEMRVPSMQSVRDRDGLTSHGIVQVEIRVEEF